jgi:hypothetical protein
MITNGHLLCINRFRVVDLVDWTPTHDDIYNIRSRSRAPSVDQRRSKGKEGIGEDDDPGLRRPGDFQQRQVPTETWPDLLHPGLEEDEASGGIFAQRRIDEIRKGISRWLGLTGLKGLKGRPHRSCFYPALPCLPEAHRVIQQQRCRCCE